MSMTIARHLHLLLHPTPISLPLSVCCSVVPCGPGSNWGGLEERIGEEVEKTGGRSLTTQSFLTFPLQFSFHDEPDKPLAVPSNQCCEYLTLLCMEELVLLALLSWTPTVSEDPSLSCLPLFFHSFI